MADEQLPATPPVPPVRQSVPTAAVWSPVEIAKAICLVITALSGVGITYQISGIDKKSFVINSPEKPAVVIPAPLSPPVIPTAQPAAPQLPSPSNPELEKRFDKIDENFKALNEKLDALKVKK